MKKFLLFSLAIIALFVFLANLGPMIFLGIGVVVLYLIFKKLMKTNSTPQKVGLVVLGLIVLSMTFHHIYALIGLASLYVLYVVYKKWNVEKEPTKNKHEKDNLKDDPFVNFDKQWQELKNL